MGDIPVDIYQYEQQAGKPNITISATLNPSDLAQIKTLFEQGKALMVQGNYQQAIVVFDQSIERLGHHYASKNLRDDTTMKLILANVEQQKDNLERAAHLKHTVLQARIQMYNELHPSQTP